MKDQRAFPVYTIEGTEFFVSVEKDALLQVADPVNQISFTKDMHQYEDHYQFYYDSLLCKAVQDAIGGARVKKVSVPQLTVLDPLGMAEKYGVSQRELAGRTDLEVMNRPELLQARLSGVLPVIDIAAEKFSVDVGLHELRPVNDFLPHISLKRMDLSEDGQSYSAYYAPIVRQLVDIDLMLTELPPGVVMIELPNEMMMDPVGSARLYGIEEKELLRLYPMRGNMKATVIPLTETRLPALIRQNRQRLQDEHQEILREAKKGRRKGFGI